VTKQEQTAIDALRSELHAYHVEVKEHVARCDGCRNDVAELKIEMNGVPGDPEKIGIVRIVANIIAKKNLLEKLGHGLWLLIVACISAGLGALIHAFI
jgi:hypothetical protein